MAGEAAVMVIVAVADFVPSATDVAVSVTVEKVGTLAGAVYVIATPEALEAVESVPHVAPLHPAPVRAQFTPLFCESFCNVALKDCVPMLACTVAVPGETFTTIAGATAVPTRLRVCGLPGALSVMISEAERVPLPVGVNITLITQVAFAASDVAQVLVSEKSLLLAPPMVMLVMLSGPLPLFVSARVCAIDAVPIVWLVNARLERLRPAVGVGAGVGVGVEAAPTHPPANTVSAKVRTKRAVGREATNPGMRFIFASQGREVSGTSRADCITAKVMLT